MHSPSTHALRHLDRYCIVLVRTLKHVSPAKCVITITYNYIYYYGCLLYLRDLTAKHVPNEYSLAVFIMKT